MASFDLLTWSPSLRKTVRVPTTETRIDFLSVKIGNGELEIKDTGGAFDFGSASLTNVADGVNPKDAVNRSQLDAVVKAPIVTGDGIYYNADALSTDYAETMVNDYLGSIVAGQIVFVKTNGRVDLAIATNPGLSASTLGVVRDTTIAHLAPGKITLRVGAIIGGYSGLIPGKKVFVSKSIAGSITQSLAAFAPGDMVYSVGSAISANQIEFDPQFVMEF